jgi:hypothetical protein
MVGFAWTTKLSREQCDDPCDSFQQTAETAAQEAARQQTRALACYPPVLIIDFYERCEVRPCCPCPVVETLNEGPSASPGKVCAHYHKRCATGSGPPRRGSSKFGI